MSGCKRCTIGRRVWSAVLIVLGIVLLLVALPSWVWLALVGIGLIVVGVLLLRM
ncbi:MAG: hypothetical protein RR739_11065 [Clostridia bacterium]